MAGQSSAMVGKNWTDVSVLGSQVFGQALIDSCVFCATFFVYIFKSLQYTILLRVLRATLWNILFFLFLFIFICFLLPTFPYWDIGSCLNLYLVVLGRSVFLVTFIRTARA